MNPHKPGRKPLQDENRKISVTTQVPQHVYARLLEAVNKQHRSISSAVAEGVEFVVNGGIPAGEPGPESTRGAVFGRILAATIADGRQAADALDLVQNSPEKILHGNPLQYSCLENPMDRGAWRATVCRVAQNWT